MGKKIPFFLIALFLFFLFLVFTYFVASGRFVFFDFNTTVRLQDHISRKFDLPFSILSLLGTAEITGVAWLILLIFLGVKKFWVAAASLFLLPIALVVEIYGKLFIFHPAPPFLFYRGVIQFHFPSEFVHTNYSYPSGHVTRTAFLICFLIVYFYLKTPAKIQSIIQPILLGSLILMMISRIYLGEHWTSDVIGGFLMGSSFGILAGLTIPLLKTKKVNHISD